MKKLTLNQVNGLIDALVSYSSDKFTEMTWEKGRIIRAYYHVIIQALVDFHFGNQALRKDALLYFESSEYFKHCEMCAIDSDVMDNIIINIDRMLDMPMDYDSNESD